MTAIVCRIESVEKHPKADRLDIYTVNGNKCISSRIAVGSVMTPRYIVGDVVLYIPVGNRVPYHLLKDGYWDDDTYRPILGGEFGNEVEKITLRGVESSGIMIPVEDTGSLHAYELRIAGLRISDVYSNSDNSAYEEVLGKDFSKQLGIVSTNNPAEALARTERVPPGPPDGPGIPPQPFG